MELEITWNRVIRIWWAYCWRGVLFSFIAGFLVGMVIGFIMGAAGFSPRAVSFVTGPVGFVLGIAISIRVMMTILKKNFGEFRLALLAIGGSSETANMPPMMNA
jgi:hypothetical protein